MTDDGFSVATVEETAANPLFIAESQKPDELWTQRIASLPVGASFTVRRQEGESVRQLKKKINKAALVHWKLLDWKTKETNLTAPNEPTNWSVKVRALDLKEKAKADAKAAQNGTQKAAQPTPEPNPTPEPSQEDAAAVGARGRR